MRSIQTKLGFFIVALISITSLTISLFGYQSANKSLKKTSDSHIDEVVSSERESISAYFETKIRIVEGIANLEGLQTVNPDQAVPLLAKMYPRYQNDFINVSFADKEGRRWNYKGEEDTVASRNYFKQAMSTGKTVISDVLVSNTTGKLSIVIAAPIMPDGKNPVGIAYTTLPLDDILSKIQQVEYKQTGFGYMFTENGIVVSHGTRPEISGITFLQDTVKQDAELKYAEDAEMMAYWNNRSNGGAPFEVEKDGKVFLNYIVKLPVSSVNPLYFGFGVEKSELREESVSLLRTFLIISCIALVFSIGFSLLFCMLTITRSIKKLSRAANAIAKGDLDVMMDIRTKDEIGEVARAMESAVERLKSYSLYINEITVSLNQMADGNLNFELNQDYAGEFAKIRQALIHIKTTMSNTLKQIVEVSHQVGGKASHLSEGSRVLAQGTTEQASAIEELSASIHDISEQVSKNASSTEQANSTTNESARLSQVSNNEMKNMVDAMEEIRETSSRIGKVIKTIEDIAFQTNILALNAAVEAARAGESGKGFAVVAEQVRNLAGMSAEAAKNSTTMIETAIQAVNNGAAIAEATAQTLGQVIDSARTSAELVNEIAAASKQQAEVISQITLGVNQIASVIQINSATAEESASTSIELTHQSEALNNLVNLFKF